MMRHVASALLVAAVLGLLAGCDQVGDQIERLFPGPTPVPSDLSGPTATPTPTSVGVAAPLAPTWTPFPTTTLAGIAAPAATIETAPTAEPTLIPLTASCAALWNLYPQGEALVSEWQRWQAQDPPSPEAHKEEMDRLLARWTAHLERLESVPPSDHALALIDLYLASADKWIRGFECASNTLATLNPACSGRAVDLHAEACDLWYQAYDRLTQLCTECVSDRPTPTATPAATPAP